MVILKSALSSPRARRLRRLLLVAADALDEDVAVVGEFLFTNARYVAKLGERRWSPTRHVAEALVAKDDVSRHAALVGEVPSELAKLFE